MVTSHQSCDEQSTASQRV